LSYILGQFKRECNCLGFSFDLNEDHFMQFLKTGKKKNKDAEIRKKIFDELNKKENFSCKGFIDPFYYEKRGNPHYFAYNC
jgi:hypothetical protein